MGKKSVKVLSKQDLRVFLNSFPDISIIQMRLKFNMVSTMVNERKGIYTSVNLKYDYSILLNKI